MANKKLRDEDCRAVDLLLDQGRAEDENIGVYVKLGDAHPERVRSVEQILTLLQEMPAEEPAADLADRTLHRVEAAMAALEAAALARPTDLVNPPPPA